MPKKELLKLEHDIAAYNPEADLVLVSRAFELAERLHASQRRKSGEDFIHHPLGVAQILAEMHMDTTTIAAGLLHDVVEDTDYSLEGVREAFDDEVAQLIDGVTKLGRIQFKSSAEEQAENLRKMLIAMAKDIRVILIKLADRLHNMRTLCYLSQEKQVEKARETLEIYAPLAHRLGIFQIKWELEDLAFFTLEPRKYNQLSKMLTESRQEREGYLDDVISMISTELDALSVSHEITGRTKHLYSIHTKIVKRGKDFGEIYDLSAVRVVVATVRDCYAVLGAIHSLWRPVPGRFKDYVAMPKFNMYQSLHTTVIGPRGKPVEVQIRTQQMHRTAEYGIAAHWRYKEGTRFTDKGEERLSWLRQMMDWQRETEDPREFMESLKVDLFEDEVFVFTPKGDVMSLRTGSTPLDFAYAVHTEVGHHCVGAKVNGQIVPLGYRLSVGDIVEVLTSKSGSGPSKDWLNLVRTSRARSKIRQWFSKEMRVDSEQAGREALGKVLKSQGITFQGGEHNQALTAVAKEMNFSRLDTLYASIGSGKVSARQVAMKFINGLTKDAEVEEVQPPTRRPSRSAVRNTGVVVKGVDDLLTRLAHCCHPVPNDEIIGFVTRGRGLSVHRADCSNVESLRDSGDRIIPVQWDASLQSTYEVEIEVEALDRTKLLRDISTIISEFGVNILSASVSTRKDKIAVFKFLFEISDVSNLDNILRGVKKIDSVFDAYRVLPQHSPVGGN